MTDRPTVAGLGERALIARLRARLSAPPAHVLVPVGDDAAIVEPGRTRLTVLTTDATVEGVHFEWGLSSPSDVGFRALAVNLSDVAAMGGEPKYALLSLGLPPATPVETFDGLLDGFLELAAAHRVALVGGNVTATSGPLFLDVTVVGALKRRKALLRGGGKPGDELYVSGTVGASAAGLRWLREAGAGGKTVETAVPSDPELAACVARFRRPKARVRLGLLAGRTRSASACMDLSDGLADAVRQVAEASGTGALVEAEAVPVDPGARLLASRAGEDPLALALGPSDDYELLFAVPRRRRRQFLAAAGPEGVTRIGALTREPGVRLRRDGQDHPLDDGFAHFR